MSGASLLQLFFSGLTIGSIYALIAVGFVVTFSVTGILNLAQGEFAAVGALTAASLHMHGAALWVSVLAGTAAAVLLGIVMERAVIRPARRIDLLSVVIITIGVDIVIRGAALMIWGADPLTLAPFTDRPPLHLGGATLDWQTVWTVAISGVFFVALIWFFRTYQGKAVRAAVMNHTAARLVGIRPSRLSFYAFAVSAGLGGLAGTIVAPITGATYDMGLMLGLKAFVAAVIGGLNNAPAAVLGGLLVGLLEAFTAGLISSDYRDAITFIVLLLMLFVRPSGLFGRTAGKRV
ncbi:branched-chain amino acid ABC transporter permease [Kyrpidia tusciae]|uniref:Inner-membrane translocator n=1 Tax=Kyrpidia tusciae (strain DSM 2912 / NBRC 15312 / T2) TaxID=562970 RepID=D5WPM9_KYRT2|nr:branched-chain amino acid ABC transporter permease [Kyrpidia tusciae]ADG06288.1 inner-membrane translocator [Kyrpidia tusciae DSM 2912]